MDHSHMDHGGHGDMDMGGDKCNMNMLFTWDTTNLCIVFRQWHIRGPASLAVSLMAIVAICAGYEALREATRRYEAWTNKQEEAAGPSEFLPLSLRTSYPFFFPLQIPAFALSPHGAGACRRGSYSRPVFPDSECLVGRINELPKLRRNNQGEASKRRRLIKSVLYGVQNFYAFMIMLLFMTYNGWVMIAVAVGAGIGYYVFGSHTKATKETACH
ncbi:hypothetical protein DL770_001154 [Monosporascus sp. CRB-9-2]|nr:hypothetical protein DL770_001154 [Monosporascus sp. CRB-9-2]